MDMGNHLLVVVVVGVEVNEDNDEDGGEVGETGEMVVGESPLSKVDDQRLLILMLY
jgi:hypothetical protein